MKASIALLAVLAASMAATACHKAAAPPAQTAVSGAPAPAPAGFQHDPAFDAAGYYTPTIPVQAGNMSLKTVAVGAESDFAQWEKGEREGVFGPILLSFEDVTSPVGTSDTGEGHIKTLRLLPLSYRLYPGEVSFKASDPALGDVTFSGAFDQQALAAAKTANASGAKPVLHGDLQIGPRLFSGVQFTYFAGD